MAAGYLLDTNVISETRKTRADPSVMAFLGAADSGGLFLSVLTLGELRKVSRPAAGPMRPRPTGSAPGWTVSKQFLRIASCRWMRPLQGCGAS